MAPKWFSDIANWCGSAVHQAKPLSGGCSDPVYCVELVNSTRVLVKLATPSAAPDYLPAQACGLEYIERMRPNSTPAVIGCNEQVLALQWLSEIAPSRSDWCAAGELLAELHQCKQAQFGFERDNYCGASKQNNGWHKSGVEFFREQRLRPQIERAKQQGLLDNGSRAKLEQLLTALENVIPQQSPSLIHGDLWSGNWLFTTAGPRLIDPACYYGWPEAELAMTQMFGAPPKYFYDVYQQHSDVSPDWWERVDYYNLYHWLNHLNLFGATYQAPLSQCIERCWSIPR